MLSHETQSNLSYTQPTLTQLLCDGNPQLTSAPENMRGDSKLLLVCLEMETAFKDVLTPKETRLKELQDQSQQLHNELLQKRRRIEQLGQKITSLDWERPNRYIHWKQRFLAFIWSARGKVVHLLKMGKGVFSKRTHPVGI